MAQEISASVSLVATKSGVNVADSMSVVFDMASSVPGAGPIPQVIGFAADEQLIFPADIPNVKLLLIENLDPTNYVQLSYTTGGGFSSFARLDPAPVSGQPGGFFFGRPESPAIYAKANTAACLVKFSIVPQ